MAKICRLGHHAHPVCRLAKPPKQLKLMTWRVKLRMLQMILTWKRLPCCTPSAATRHRPKKSITSLLLVIIFFPTCQVRVVRFYQSCSSPLLPPPPRSPPPPLPPLPYPLPPCQLFAKLFANFRTQWPLLDLNCKGLSALGTAGPQPGTLRAQ